MLLICNLQEREELRRLFEEEANTELADLVFELWLKQLRALEAARSDLAADELAALASAFVRAAEAELQQNLVLSAGEADARRGGGGGRPLRPGSASVGGAHTNEELSECLIAFLADSLAAAAALHRQLAAAHRTLLDQRVELLVYQLRLNVRPNLKHADPFVP